MMPKQLLLLTLTALTTAVVLATPAWCAADTGLSWTQFKDRFMSQDGRIIDYYQNDISHSEGQGYGMLLAWAHDDREAFDLLWKWARNNLQVRKSDALFAWSWGQRSKDNWTVIDLNNATDGDILIAMSLLLAHEKWGENSYKNQALPVLADIKKFLLLEKKGLLCLLPGYYGFLNDTNMLLNPAYYIFSAFRVFARHDDKSLWMRLHHDGMKLLQAALDNPLKLPPDWLLWGDNGAAIPPDKGAVFSYEAIRVPLYLSWDQGTKILDGLPAFLDIVARLERVPPRTDLNGQSISLQEASAGFYAVMARAAHDLGHANLGETLWKRAQVKVATEDRNYYSNTLFLLAEQEMSP